MTHSVTANSLDAKTLLLAVEFGKFGNRRKLSDDQYSVDAEKDADAKKKSYTSADKKRLQSKALLAIVNHDNATRRMVEAKTLPSLLKPGIYRLPTVKLSEVIGLLEQRKAERTDLVAAFGAAYSEDVAKARENLGGLFNADDYPPVDEALAEFEMSYRFLSSGVPESLADIDPKTHAEELAKYHEHITQAERAYTSLLRVAMADLIDHLVAMLQPTPDGRKKRIFAAGFENLGDFLREFPARNVADDKELAKLAKRAQQLLDGTVDVEAIRDDERMREIVFEKFSEIKSSLDGMVTVEDRKFGKRKIKLGEAA